MNAVEIRDIVKEFPAGERPVRVLHGVSCNIPIGKLSMLVGPSGCGKTTLISIVSGILSSTSGDVHVLGEPLTNMRDSDKVKFRRKRIGFIFQQYNLLPALTAAENAAIALTADGMAAADALPKARAVLEKIGMKGHTEKFPRQLSGGQQQRVAIARALVHNPELIVCDEPTAALDASTGQQVMQILRDVADESNRAVLVVTHDNRIYHFADRIITMSDGQITGDFEGQEFLSRENAA